MVSFCDIRYSTKDAYFQVKEAALGKLSAICLQFQQLTFSSLFTFIGLAADVGALQYLPKIIGNQSLVRELCFTARRFDGVEANQIGFTSKVFDDKERCVKSAICLQFSK